MVLFNFYVVIFFLKKYQLLHPSTAHIKAVNTIIQVGFKLNSTYQNVLKVE